MRNIPAILYLRKFHRWGVFCSRLVNVVVFVHFGSGIDHIYGFESFLMKFLIQGFGVGESRFVECENTVSVHVVDVHPDSIARDIPATEVVCDFPYFLLAAVGETT